MQILNIAGYKFITLKNLTHLRENYRQYLASLAIKGTILLSEEGININLAGYVDPIKTFISYLKNDPRFLDLRFHETYSSIIPYRRLKIKLKNEIITLRQAETDVRAFRAPSISPELFKTWLDENREMTIIDTRNTYEVEIGTFKNAIHFPLNRFTEFPSHLSAIDSEKPIVMFCTGGIRCEKAALYLIQQGMSAVYQLDGGILGYFNKVGGAHYDGKCFVFDDRAALSAP